ncbi:MAG: hypothetical protein IJ561_03275 [Ruminococcus sp.]|nr:hypothetical protein [Ruminococcus sp.]
MDFKELLYRIQNIEFEDIFPLYRREKDLRNLLINVGIYMGVIILSLLLLIFLGDVFILGVILWIVGVISIVYSLVGMTAELLRFMKYN